MLLLIEIGMLIFGLVALIRGRFTISKKKVVVGVPARLLGLAALSILPIALAVGVLFAVSQGPGDPQQFVDDNRLKLAGIEAAIVIGMTILIFVIGAMVAVTPEEADRREGKGRYEGSTDFDDEYDRPRRGKRSDYDDDDRDENFNDDRGSRKPWDR